ncbi:hypothetical protein WA158_005198 [Blastocystis sp. Blastoise]
MSQKDEEVDYSWYKDYRALLEYFKNQESADAFREPVRWKEWQLYEYPKLVKQPMDFSTIEKKFRNKDYKYPFEFAYDMRLVFRDCMTFNTEASALYQDAKTLSNDFESRYAQLSNNHFEWRNCYHLNVLKQSPLLLHINELTTQELSQLIQIIDMKCEKAISYNDKGEIVISVELLDVLTFKICDLFISDCIEHRTAKETMAIQAEKKSKSSNQTAASSSVLLSNNEVDIPESQHVSKDNEVLTSTNDVSTNGVTTNDITTNVIHTTTIATPSSKDITNTLQNNNEMSIETTSSILPLPDSSITKEDHSIVIKNDINDAMNINIMSDTIMSEMTRETDTSNSSTYISPTGDGHINATNANDANTTTNSNANDANTTTNSNINVTTTTNSDNTNVTTTNYININNSSGTINELENSPSFL